MASLETLLATFRTWDASGNGFISEPHLRSVLLALGMCVEAVEKLAKRFNSDVDGQINYTVFLTWVMGSETPQTISLSNGRQEDAVPQVVIVGAGVTGSLLAMLATEAGLSVHIIEKSRGAGGRMSTHSFRRGDRSSPVLGRADLGAQYITTRSSPHDLDLDPLYKRLSEFGVLAPMVGEIVGPNPFGDSVGAMPPRNFIAPAGLSSVAKYFLETSGAPVSYGRSLEELSLDDSGNAVLKLSGGDSVEIASPGVVVLTQPVGQVLGESRFPIRGNFMQLVSAPVLEGLRKVQYSSRFAAVYYFDAPFAWPYSWVCSYFQGGDVRYVAYDTAKRAATEASASVLVHSGVPLGLQCGDEEDPFPIARQRLQHDLEIKMPEVPWTAAVERKLHKWKYSQVYKAFGGVNPQPDWTYDASAEVVPGFVELFCSSAASALICGDAFAPASNFEGCVFSARRTFEALQLKLAVSR